MAKSRRKEQRLVARVGQMTSVAAEASEETRAPVRVQSDAPTLVDELGRTRHVAALADVILTAETPIVLAIYGGWGTGKTSVMLQLRERLASMVSDSATGPAQLSGTVWFEPWMHESDDNPALGLLHQAVTDLGQSHNRAVRSALKNVARAMVSEVHVPFINLRMGSVIDAAAEGEFRKREAQARLRHEFRSVLDAVTRGHERVVFFIDDLDRCEPRTALTLLKALRLYLGLEHCVFVLAIDRRHLEAAVAQEYAGLDVATESFLDKIVQLPFILPPVPAFAMAEYVAQRLPPQLKSCEAFLTAAGADHPRLVKRLINVLVVTDSLVDEESFLPDGYDPAVLASLVLIQDQAPPLYDVLRRDPASYGDLLPGSDATKDDEVTTELSALWVEYVAPNPRLAEALRLVAHASEVNLRPYLTLASTAALPSPDGDGGGRRGPSVGSLLFADDAAWTSAAAGIAAVRPLAQLGLDRTAETAAYRDLLESLRVALDVPLSELLLQGWSRYRVVQEALRLSTAAPTETTVLDVAEHTVNSRFKPRVDLLLDEVAVASLETTVDVSFRLLPGASVVVGAGRILAVEGNTEVSARLTVQATPIQHSQRALDLGTLLGAEGTGSRSP